jgi:hypothetical protein
MLANLSNDILMNGIVNKIPTVPSRNFIWEDEIDFRYGIWVLVQNIQSRGPAIEGEPNLKKANLVGDNPI